MANDLNQCNFIGRLGGDVTIKYMPSGSAVAEFSIAVGESWKSKQTGEKQENTEWINITAFGKLAEICGEYLKKGSQVFITGKFHTDKWEDKAGNTRYSTKIRANNMQMIGGRPQQNGNQSATRPVQTSQAAPVVNTGKDAPNSGFAEDDFDDDLPF